MKTINCDTFSDGEKVTVVVPVTSVEVTCSEAMLALSFSTLLIIIIMVIFKCYFSGELIALT